MAEHSAAGRKAELIAELERSRRELAGNIRGIRRDVSVGTHLKVAFARRKTAFLVGAALVGWVLSRLPSRKARRTAAPTVASTQDKENPKSAFWFTLLTFAITVMKPALTAIASRKLTEFATRDQSEGRPRRHAGRW